MNKLSCSLLLLLPSVALCGNEFENFPEVKAISAGLPSDLKSFIARTVECNHWSGEEPYDRERAEYIQKAMRKAECGKLQKDEAALRSKHKANKKFLEAIDKSKNLSF